MKRGKREKSLLGWTPAEIAKWVGGCLIDNAIDRMTILIQNPNAIHLLKYLMVLWMVDRLDG